MRLADARKANAAEESAAPLHQRVGTNVDRRFHFAPQPAQLVVLKHAQQLRRGHDEQVRKALAEFKAIAEKLVASPLRVKAKAGEDGRLFGSITANELAKQLQERSEGAIDRRQIHLAEPIRNLGTHEVTVRLHPEVSATVTVEVVRE